jgi:hypothetical protein
MTRCCLRIPPTRPEDLCAHALRSCLLVYRGTLFYAFKFYFYSVRRFDRHPLSELCLSGSALSGLINRLLLRLLAGGIDLVFRFFHRRLEILLDHFDFLLNHVDLGLD